MRFFRRFKKMVRLYALRDMLRAEEQKMTETFDRRISERIAMLHSLIDCLNGDGE